jgi:hypothetical protein
MDTKILREQLFQLLDGGNAHITLEKTVDNFPMDHINSRVQSIPHSSWDLIEHIRLAQFDILEFIENPEYKERKWPDDYWPDKAKKASAKDWQKSIKQFNEDLESLKTLVRNPQLDLTAPIPHAPEYTILRELLLVCDHNAYHTGQIICIRRALHIY